MLEVALRVSPEAAEEVLDRLLPIAPHGVYEVPIGDELELRVRGARAELPARDAVLAAAREHALGLTERELPDDWAARRLLDYEPRVIGGRLVVRPEWAPPAASGLIDVVLEERDAFGGGGHPTTSACLEQICQLDPGGSFADLGCGSGVLAIAAALLGFEEVIAIDREQGAVAAARANAERNGVVLEVRSADLAAEEPPPAETVVANVPPEVHAAIAMRLSAASRTLIASGLLPGAADHVAARYAAAGFHELRRSTAGGWTVLVLGRAA